MKFKHGFTLSEILITLLIIGFVAALGVPMLGQQKMKRPNQKELGHGVFECFYDNDGILTQFTADSENNRLGTRTPVAAGNTCHFDPPAANFFMITAIGYGGDGGLFNPADGYPDYDVDSRDATVEVSTNGNFQTSLRDAANTEGFGWILAQREDGQTNWDFAAPSNTINYTLTPRVGRGGDAAIKIDRQYNRIPVVCQSCSTETRPIGCPKDCLIVSSATGGDSAEWYKLLVPNVRLSSNTSVSYDKESDYSIFKIIENNVTKSAKLWNVPGGKDGKCSNGGCTHGENGKQEDDKIEPSCDGLECRKLMTQPKRSGGKTVGEYPDYTIARGQNGVTPTLEASQESITCGYRYSILRSVRYGEAGVIGGVVTRVYEKLPAAGLDIYPSETRENRSWVSLAGGDRIIETGISENGGIRTDSEDEEVLMHEENSNRFPFPEKWLRHARSVTPPVQSYGNPSMPTGMVGITPGAPGFGAYPYIVNVNDASYSKWIGNETISGNVDEPVVAPGERVCESGEAPRQVPGNNNRWYCRATQGQRGAVIIAW